MSQAPRNRFISHIAPAGTDFEPVAAVTLTRKDAIMIQVFPKLEGLCIGYRPTEGSSRGGTVKAEMDGDITSGDPADHLRIHR
jgi:hypothetical protein